MELTLANVSFILAGIVFLTVLVAALRRRILLRIGFRNVLRRKTQVAIAVAGLTVATSIISGALVIDDSFDATVIAIVLRGTDHVDEIIYLQTEGGWRDFFDYSVYENLRGNISTMENVDGLAPRIHLPASIRDNRTDLVQPQANIIAFDPALDLGSFYIDDETTADGGDLAADEVYINEALAEELEAEAGDELQVFVNGEVLNVRVREVVRDKGRGGWATAEDIFIRLPVLQEALGLEGRINLVLVSNVGGVDDGHLATDGALADMEAVLGEGHPFTIEAIKRDRIDLFTSLMEGLTQLFTLMSAFTVIAGVLLIMNIFSMMAEERKTEMGMSRALGMRRSHLVQAFIFEGFIYALASSILGAFAGLGVATIIMAAFGQIFTFFARDLTIAYEPESLMTAFSLGLLLTLFTISLASWRISKLNIVRAIRDLPEPPVERATRLELLTAALLIFGGTFTLYYGFRETNEMAYVAGAPLVALGLAGAAVRRLGPRLPMTLAGLFTIGWVLSPYRLVEETDASILMFILVGVMLVAGGVLTVMVNSEFLLKLGTKVTRDKRNLPVVKAAVAYPMAKKFRTGITLAMFALIMFTITVMSMVMALTGSTVDVFARMESGGYDILGFAHTVGSGESFEERLNSSGLAESIEYQDGLLLSRATLESPSLDAIPYSLIGVSEGFSKRNNFTFHMMAEGYDSPREVWRAVREDPSLAVIDRTAQPVEFGPSSDFEVAVGEGLTITNALGDTRNVTIIGVLDASFVRGVFISSAVLEEFAGMSRPNLYYVRAVEGEDVGKLARTLEREFVDYGLEVFVIRDLVEESMEVTLNVMQLIQAFLALGLAVGISGLGVLAVRNVVERRSMIGTLRALGFRKDMVLKAFLLELSFVAVLGILLGLILGIALSYNLFTAMDIFQDAEFVIPWPNLLFILVFSFIASVLATLSPSIRASKMPPAEALRQVL
ncbi:MAG: ABC transporter permease [Thermoplasmata archaeon]